MGASEAIKISVLIPSWQRPASLGRCLNALEAQSRPPDEVVLSVRADDAATREMLAARSLPFPASIATPPRPGMLAALNAGYDMAAGDVIVATDDDVAPHRDWLERIGRRFAEDPGLGALGGPDRMILQTDLPREGVPGLPVGRVEWYGRIVGNHHLGAGEYREVDIIKGANLAIRASALGDRRIDTALRGEGAEHHTELDLCLGLKRAGWRLAYDPAIVVDHFEETRHSGARELWKSSAERSDSIHNQTLGLLKHLPPGRREIALTYAVLVGSREAPGVLLAIERRLRRREDSGARLGGSLRARFEGFRTWVRRRRRSS